MIDFERLMDYEAGNLSDKDMIQLFADLIRTGLCWSLQGHYGRTAKAMISEGYINEEGIIIKTPQNE